MNTKETTRTDSQTAIARRRPRPTNKFPISWHKDGLKNSKNYLARQQAELERMENAVDRLRKDVEFTEWQIEEAERAGLSEFDAQRFRASRKGLV